MKIKILYCERCDNITFPDSVEMSIACKVCHKAEDFRYVEIEVEGVGAKEATSKGR